jgi:dihydroneopterin aldolase
MLSIHLNNLIFFSHHGIHAEEKILGNHFEVNLTVRHRPVQLPVKHLTDTIDYAAVFQLVRERMSQPTPLLETIVTELAETILHVFPLAEEVDVAIRKLHPPISEINGSVGVSFSLKRSQR